MDDCRRRRACCNVHYPGWVSLRTVTIFHDALIHHGRLRMGSHNWIAPPRRFVVTGNARGATVNNTTLWFLMAATLIVAAIAGADWIQASAELSQIRVSELKPIAALLKEDQELLQALRTDSPLENDSRILGSYLAKIRADGLPKHTNMKQRLNRLTENNAAIV